MRLFRNRVSLFVFTALFVFSNPPVWASGDHGQPDKHEMGEEKHMDHPEKKESEHGHHTIKKEANPTFPEGTKEVVIDLSGPFCSRHPEEIVASLKKLEGVLHVEAFNRRDYVLIHFTPEKVAPKAMAEQIDKTKGSGWRCIAKVSTRRRTER